MVEPKGSPYTGAMKNVFIAVVFLLFGLIVGSTISKYLARRHQHATSVMALTQFHLDRLSDAVRAGNCAASEQEMRTLQLFADEVALAFPLANAQDQTFHGYLAKLQSAVAPTSTPAGQCAINQARLQKIRDACDECHRDYR